MKRIKLEVAYDGSHYHGWQIQPNAITVEAVINKALTELLKQEIKVIGASRTDAGVHAYGNVAVFDTDTRIPPEKIAFALNQRLPEDIRIQSSYEVEREFHPRHCACIKTYEYQIFNASIELPTERFYSYHVTKRLNLEHMQQAASYIIGEHDYKSFCSAKTQVIDTVRTVYSLEIQQEGHKIKVQIRGNGFLYNMVRIIVGTLLQVGVGFYPPEYVKEILDAKDRTMAGPNVPAKGLCLVQIAY